MKEKILLPVLLFFLFSFNGIALPKITFYQGQINLTTGECLVGEIGQDMHYELAFFRSNGIIRSFPARDVTALEFFDEEYELLRKFIVLDYKTRTLSHTSKIFFEVIVNGSFSILYRDNNINGGLKTVPENSIRMSILNIEYISNPRYAYYLYYNHEFIYINSFKNEVLPLLRNKFGSSVDVFISDYKLKLKEVEDQILILDYFNHLTDQDLYGFND